MGAGVGREISAVRSDPHPAPSVDPHPARAADRPTLVVDVGTSWTKLALVSTGHLVRLDALRTGAGCDDAWGAGWEACLEASLAPHGRDLGDIGGVVVSSVVAPATDGLRALAARVGARLPVRFVTPTASPLPVDYQPPDDIGPDRIADAVGALDRWGAPVVVIDIGTATTCDLVSADGRFVGGAIAPGPWTACDALVGRAPLLGPAAATLAAGALAASVDTPLVGTTTADCLRVGLLRGTAALVDGLARGYHRIVGPCPVVATGGLAPIVAELSDTITDVDPDLTLRGIYLSCTGRPNPHP
jgi:type III pantothenate kinase